MNDFWRLQTAVSVNRVRESVENGNEILNYDCFWCTIRVENGPFNFTTEHNGAFHLTCVFFKLEQMDTLTSNPATLQIPTVFLQSKRKTFLSKSCQTPAETYEARRPLPRPPQNNKGQKSNLSIIQFTDGSKRNMPHLFLTTLH